RGASWCGASRHFLERNHVDVDPPRAAHELVDHGAAEDLAPAREVRLADDDVLDAVLAGEVEDRLRDIVALELHGLGAERARELEVLHETALDLGVDDRRRFAGRLDVDDEPPFIETPRDSRAAPKELLRLGRVRGEANEDAFRGRGRLILLARGATARARACLAAIAASPNVLGDLAEGHLAQARKILGLEEACERLLDLLGAVDLARLEP